MEFEITNDVSEKDRNSVFQGLLKYNRSHLGDSEPEDLGIYLRNEEGIVTAGLVGNTFGLWLMVRYLWISEELREQGIGSRLLLKAEETAKERGCRYVFLDTFSFQAPDFYKKYGYTEVLTLENYPVDGKRHYFTKML